MRRKRRLHRRERKHRNKVIVMSMFALVLLLSCGYAAFQTSISLKAKGTIKEATSVASLKKLVVTSGDGLYADSTESGRYIYKGTNPDNYIEIQETDSSKVLYRIIAIESDGTLKVIRNDSIGNMLFDSGYSTSINGVTEANSTSGTRYSSASTDYCYSSTESEYHGCNVWGSITTMLDSSGNNVTSMPKEYGSSTTYSLPATEAYLNTYLNSIWYNTLSTNFKNKIVNHIFNVGHVVWDGSYTQTLETDLKQESSYKWKGNIGLFNLTDYVKANTNTSLCGTINLNNSKAGNQSTCKTTNWLFNSTYLWTNSPRSGGTEIYLISVDGHVSYGYGQASDYVRPTLFLSSNTKLLGDGTITNAYKIIN